MQSYPDVPSQGAACREWLVLFKGCNAGLGHLGGSLRASWEALARGVAPLGKDQAIACEARLAANHFPTRCIRNYHVEGVLVRQPTLNTREGTGSCLQDNRAVGNSRLAPMDGLSVSCKQLPAPSPWHGANQVSASLLPPRS
jgi:hypothetical protein